MRSKPACELSATHWKIPLASRVTRRPTDVPDPRTFRPVVDTRAHENVVDEIAFGIRSGVYRVGEKLPTVAGLAHQFRVSKPTIGEAIRLLSEHGIVESKRGVTGGVTVINDDIPISLLGLVPQRRQTDVRSILEARRPVEIEIARLAFHRANEEDIVAMRESIEKLEEHVRDDQHVRLHYDHLFHYAMARAARSDLLAYYQHQILKQLVIVLQEYFLEEEDPLSVIDLHRRTLEALVGRSERVLLAVMDEHLGVTEAATAAYESAKGSPSGR
jgi:GntR family transcriptional regulator, transcriptional repressor for pyruvate dehydrogenase complex